MNKIGRRPRTHKLNTIYHVMMRGNNRQTIFFHEDYFQRFLHLIDESTKKFDYEILAYCLMTNLIHLIIHIQESPLSERSTGTLYRQLAEFNHASDHYFSNDFLKKIDDEIQMKLLIFNKISLWFKL